MPSELERRIDNAEPFEERVADVLHYKHRWRWRLLTIWIIVFTIVVMYIAQSNRSLIRENKTRIIDIQQSRIFSCKKIYLTIQQILKVSLQSRPESAERTRSFRILIGLADPKKCVNQAKLR